MLNSDFAARCAAFSPRCAALLSQAQSDAAQADAAYVALLEAPGDGADGYRHETARRATSSEVAFWMEAAYAAPSTTAMKRALRAGGRDLEGALTEVVLRGGVHPRDVKR